MNPEEAANAGWRVIAEDGLPPKMTPVQVFEFSSHGLQPDVGVAYLSPDGEWLCVALDSRWGPQLQRNQCGHITHWKPLEKLAPPLGRKRVWAVYRYAGPMTQEAMPQMLGVYETVDQATIVSNSIDQQYVFVDLTWLYEQEAL